MMKGNFFFNRSHRDFVKKKIGYQKSFLPLVILISLIFYGIYSSYKKKIERHSDLINQLNKKYSDE